MKRRTKIHLGDTYGDTVNTACGAHVPRDLAKRQCSPLVGPVTCEKCRRVVEERRAAK